SEAPAALQPATVSEVARGDGAAVRRFARSAAERGGDRAALYARAQARQVGAAGLSRPRRRDDRGSPARRSAARPRSAARTARRLAGRGSHDPARGIPETTRDRAWRHLPDG